MSEKAYTVTLGGVPVGRSFRPTGDLRLAVPPHTTTEAPRLQREFEFTDNGERFWEDVPRVVVPALAKATP